MSISAEKMQQTWEEGDLSSLACMAAIELDHLVLKKPTDLHATSKLAGRLSDVLGDPSSSRLQSPTAVLVVKRAIQDSNWSQEPLVNVEDLVREASKISRELEQVASTDAPSDLVKVRLFCVVLSKLALASERSQTHARPDHPFRK